MKQSNITKSKIISVNEANLDVLQKYIIKFLCIGESENVIHTKQVTLTTKFL